MGMMGLSMSTSPQLRRNDKMSRIERDAFTKEWLDKQFLPGMNKQMGSNAKMEFVRTILYQPDVPEDQTLLMRLSLDYEFESGLTLFPFILDMIEHSRPSRSEPLPSVGYQFCLMMRPRQNYFYRLVLSNIQRHGYTRFESFTFHDIWARPLGLSPPASPRPMGYFRETPTITALSLAVRLRCQMSRMPGYCSGGVVECSINAPDEMAFLEWSEQLVLLLLNQPTLSDEIKIRLVNQPSSHPSEPLLSSIILASNFSLPLFRSILKYADINLVLDGKRNLAPLYCAVSHGHVGLLIEMLLNQRTNLMEVDLTGGQSDPSSSLSVSESDTRVLLYVRTLLCVYPDSSKNILKRIIERLYQWQQEQLKQLETNANFQPNDASVRDWLQQQFATLPVLLWSDQMSTQLSLIPTEHLTGERLPRLVDRWVKQLNHAPHLIHLLATPTTSRQSLLWFSIETSLLLTREFRPHLQRVFALLEESNFSFVDDLILFESWSSIFTVLTKKLEDVSNNPISIERTDQANILFSIFTFGFKRINHILEVYEEDAYLTNRDYLARLKLLYGYDRPDHELLQDLARWSQSIADGLSDRVWQIIWGLAKYSSIDLFKEMWLHHFPTLSFFRLNELKCYHHFLHCLIELAWSRYEFRTPESLERFRNFLSDPFFQNSDTFQPAQLFPSKKGNPREGLTIVERMTRHDPFPKTAPEFGALVKRLESDWFDIHSVTIKNNLNQYLINDLSNIVMNYLQTSKPTAQAAQWSIHAVPIGFGTSSSTAAASSSSSHLPLTATEAETTPTTPATSCSSTDQSGSALLRYWRRYWLQ